MPVKAEFTAIIEDVGLSADRFSMESRIVLVISIPTDPDPVVAAAVGDVQELFNRLRLVKVTLEEIDADAQH